jgi:hypothetical protein
VGLPPQKGSGGGEAHQQEPDAVGSRQLQRSLPGRARKGIAEVEPREAQVVKLAAEVFQAGPDERNEQPAPPQAEPRQAQPRQRDEQAEPKGINDPKRDCPARKHPTEEFQPNRRDQESDRESRIKRLAPTVHLRQLQQGKEVKDNQRAGVNGGVSRVKSGRRNHDPEKDDCEC